jgi:hypothetical protein
MEKQTKILLGLGAVIAAYLILKPKKDSAQTSVVTQNTKKVCPKGQELVRMTCIMAPCPDVCMPSNLQEKIKAAVMPTNWELNTGTITSF